MKKLIMVLVIATLLLALAPAVVYAAPSEGTVTGQGKGGNTAPTVDALLFVETGSDNQVFEMLPLTEYRVKATIEDFNTIDDIQDIEFHVYHTSSNPQSASSKWDADQCAIFKWTKSGGVWSMENDGATTTWVLGTCTAPTTMTNTIDDWYLGFIPGELAMADASANWHAWVRADDENKNGTGSTATGASMGDYNEISLDTATIVFGDAEAGIEPGATDFITSDGADPITYITYITTQVASNNTYALGVKSAATWDDKGTNTIDLSGTTTRPPDGSGKFSLFIDTLTAGLPGEPKAYTQAVTTTNATIAGHSGDGPTTTVDDANEGTDDLKLYMALSLAELGINEVTYEGTITFTVTN